MKEYLEQLAGAADLISHPSDLSLSGTFLKKKNHFLPKTNSLMLYYRMWC